jgi:hypothetical protein
MAIEECRIYKPNKDGILTKRKTISAKQCQEKFWEEGPGFDKLMQTTKQRDTFIKHETQNYVCETCNQEFKAIAEREYCHNPCTDPKDITTRPDLELSTRKCEVCKKDFEPTTRRHIYCNDPCVSQNKKRASNLVKYPKCKQCKKTFRAPDGKQKYCWNPCTRYTAYKLKRPKANDKLPT